MTTYKTGNPIGSTAVKDLYDNAENLDTAVNDISSDTWSDRLGRSRKTMSGMERQFDAAEDYRESTFVLTQTDKQNRFNNFIASSGYQFLGDYAAGIEITEYNQIVRDSDGEFWRLSGEVELPYTTTGAGLPEDDSLTPLGDAVLRQQLSDSETIGLGADLVADVPRYINVKSRGARSGQNSQSAIEQSIAEAMDSGAVIWWPEGEYISTSNIPNFWSVKHEGPGKIVKPEGDIWHITPTGNAENLIWVADPSSSGNDGLSKSSAVPAQVAFNNLSTIGSKSSDGNWIIRISGEISHNGVRVSRPLPIFRNRLQIIGDDVEELNDVPTTVWHGDTSTNDYGIRIERNTAPALFMLIRNIKFKNWYKGVDQSGAVVIWDAGGVRCENIHVDGAGVGLWFRCNVVVERGVIENCTSRGTSFEYHSTFNIGRVDRDYGVTIKNCGVGVQIGRNSVGYVQGCTLENNRTNIAASRLSRFRARNNLHKNWINAAYNNALVGVFTPDNDSGQPDIFEHTDSSAPVYNAEYGSVHMHIERGGHRTVHLVSNSDLISISNRSGDSLLLSAVGNPTFTPFRLPAFALKNPSIRIDVEIFAVVSAGATGVFALNGQGTGTNSRLAACTIPPSESSLAYKIIISVFRQPGRLSPRYRVKLETTNGHTIQSGSSPNPNTTPISEHSEEQMIYRLFWEPTTNENVQFYGMRSYVEY